MTKKTEKFLQDFTFPEKEVRKHKKVLKMLLLAQYDSQLQNKSLRKGGEMDLRKILKYSSLVIAFVVVILALTVWKDSPINVFHTEKAQAQEVVNKAMDKFFTLTDDEKKIIQQKIQADLMSSLEEARAAEDLEVVPEEEIQRIDPPKFEGEGIGLPSREKKVIGFRKEFVHEDMEKEGFEKAEPGTRAMMPGEGKVMAPHNTTVLRYTNPQGAKVILGIDENDQPVMKMVTLRKEDLKEIEGSKDNLMFFEKKID